VSPPSALSAGYAHTRARAGAELAMWLDSRLEALEGALNDLRAAEARQRLLLSILPDLMFRLRRDGTYLEFAGDLSRLATPADELLGSNIHAILPAEVARALMGCAERALASQRVEHVEYRLRTLAGPICDFEARVVPSGPDEVLAVVRDETERNAVEAELRASRARVLHAADQERRRLERNLHDGAQQRLLSASMRLHVVALQLDSDPSAAKEALRVAQEELTEGLDEIRELVRGLHPTVLVRHGLGVAVAGLAERSLVPVELGALPAERLPAEVEATAYYVIAEALANAAKHAQARVVRIAVEQAGVVLRVTVADDGAGGARLDPVGGLQGLHDRVSVVGGQLEIASARGVGTTVAATIPLALSPR
jgi:signal transduction histidine kinase